MTEGQKEKVTAANIDWTGCWELASGVTAKNAEDKIGTADRVLLEKYTWVRDLQGAMRTNLSGGKVVYPSVARRFFSQTPPLAIVYGKKKKDDASYYPVARLRKAGLAADDGFPQEAFNGLKMEWEEALKKKINGDKEKSPFSTQEVQGGIQIAESIWLKPTENRSQKDLVDGLNAYETLQDEVLFDLLQKQDLNSPHFMIPDFMLAQSVSHGQEIVVDENEITFAPVKTVDYSANYLSYIKEHKAAHARDVSGSIKVAKAWSDFCVRLVFDSEGLKAEQENLTAQHYKELLTEHLQGLDDERKKEFLKGLSEELTEGKVEELYKRLAELESPGKKNKENHYYNEGTWSRLGGAKVTPAPVYSGDHEKFISLLVSKGAFSDVFKDYPEYITYCAGGFCAFIPDKKETDIKNLDINSYQLAVEDNSKDPIWGTQGKKVEVVCWPGELSGDEQGGDLKGLQTSAKKWCDSVKRGPDHGFYIAAVQKEVKGRTPGKGEVNYLIQSFHQRRILEEIVYLNDLKSTDEEGNPLVKPVDHPWQGYLDIPKGSTQKIIDTFLGLDENILNSRASAKELVEKIKEECPGWDGRFYGAAAKAIEETQKNREKYPGVTLRNLRFYSMAKELGLTFPSSQEEWNWVSYGVTGTAYPDKEPSTTVFDIENRQNTHSTFQPQGLRPFGSTKGGALIMPLHAFTWDQIQQIYGMKKDEEGNKIPPAPVDGMRSTLGTYDNTRFGIKRENGYYKGTLRDSSGQTFVENIQEGVGARADKVAETQGVMHSVAALEGTIGNCQDIAYMNGINLSVDIIDRLRQWEEVRKVLDFVKINPDIYKTGDRAIKIEDGNKLKVIKKQQDKGKEKGTGGQEPEIVPPINGQPVASTNGSPVVPKKDSAKPREGNVRK